MLDRLLAEEDRPVPERLAEMARQAVASLPEAQITLPLLYEFYALASRPGPIQQTIVCCAPRRPQSERASAGLSSCHSHKIGLAIP